MESSLADAGAFRAVYREHYGFVWATVRRFGVSPALVDDAVQDAFVVAYRRRSELHADRPRPWLYRIARGVASNYRRSARRFDRKRRAVAHATSAPLARPHEPHALLHDLDRFLGDLSARDRELFVLSEVEGLTGPELAQTLGCNMSTAYGRVRTLRQRFADQGDDGALTEARRRRPRASTKRWTALVAAIRTPTPGWPSPSAGTSTWMASGAGATATVTTAVTTTAIAAAVAVAVTIAWRAPERPPRSTPVDARARATAMTDATGPPMPSPSPDPPASRPGLDPGFPSAAPSPARTPSPRASTPTPSSSASSTDLDPSRRPPSDRAAPSESIDDLARQNALLREASGALASGDPDRALEAMRQHATEFPRSALSDLRTALRVEALCAQGKGAQARGEARAHVSAHPHSPTAERIRNACPADSRQTGHSMDR